MDTVWPVELDCEAQSGGAGGSLSTFSKRNQRKFQEYGPQEGSIERHIREAQFKSPPFAKHSSVELPLGPLGSPQRRCCLQVFLCFPFSLYLCLSPDMEKEQGGSFECASSGTRVLLFCQLWLLNLMPESLLLASISLRDL